jgi:hypothetical protein
MAAITLLSLPFAVGVEHAKVQQIGAGRQAYTRPIKERVQLEAIGASSIRADDAGYMLAVALGILAVAAQEILAVHHTGAQTQQTSAQFTSELMPLSRTATPIPDPL